jgi:hypothetical protein
VRRVACGGSGHPARHPPPPKRPCAVRGVGAHLKMQVLCVVLPIEGHHCAGSDQPHGARRTACVALQQDAQQAQDLKVLGAGGWKGVQTCAQVREHPSAGGDHASHHPLRIRAWHGGQRLIEGVQARLYKCSVAWSRQCGTHTRVGKVGLVACHTRNQVARDSKDNVVWAPVPGLTAKQHTATLGQGSASSRVRS